MKRITIIIIWSVQCHLLPTGADLRVKNYRLIVAACIVELVRRYVSCLHTLSNVNDLLLCRVRCWPDGSWQQPRVRHPFLCVDLWLPLLSTRYTFPMDNDTLCPVEFSSELSRISCMSRIARIEIPTNHLCHGCHYKELFGFYSFTPFIVCGLVRCWSNCPRGHLFHFTPHVFSVLISVSSNSLKKQCH
jgi:hypothetical protein